MRKFRMLCVALGLAVVTVGSAAAQLAEKIITLAAAQNAAQIAWLGPQAHLSCLADVAIAPDGQICVEAHRNRQSPEPFQVQRCKIEIQGWGRHPTSR